MLRSGDFTLLPLASKGYRHRIRQLNADIRAYLHAQAITASPHEKMPDTKP